MKRVLHLIQKENYFLQNLTKAFATDDNSATENYDAHSEYNIPIGSHLYLIYIKLHLLLDWKNKASAECKSMERLQSSKEDPGATFTKNVIENRLELFFHPLSDIIGVLKNLWIELLDFIIKSMSVQGAKLYDPYSSLEATDIIIRKNFNVNIVPWYDVYSNLLGIYSRIIASRGKYLSSTQLDFINYDNFISVWTNFIIGNISNCFKEHFAAGSSETLIDLLCRVDGHSCLGLIAWIYFYALPLFSSLFNSEPSKKAVFCLTFMLHLRTFLVQYLETGIASKITPNQLDLSKIPPSDCLYLLSWISTFYKRIRAILSHSELVNVQLSEILTENQIDFIVRRYVTHTTGMVKEWLGNLFSAEYQKIILRIEPPDSNRFGKYYASISGEVFLFLDQVCTCLTFSFLGYSSRSYMQEYQVIS